MRDTLHWFPIAQRISYRIAAFVWRCLLGSAPAYMYLCELCIPASGLPGRRALRSYVTGQLLVPRATTATRDGSRTSDRGTRLHNGGLGLGSRGKAPGQRVRGTKFPRSWWIFLISETNFLTKLSHKFGKFRLHGGRQRCLSEHRWWGTVPLFTYFYSRPRPAATAC